MWSLNIPKSLRMSSKNVDLFQRVHSLLSRFSSSWCSLPAVLLVDRGASEIGIAVSVDSVAHFLMVRGLDRTIEGDLIAVFESVASPRKPSIPVGM